MPQVKKILSQIIYYLGFCQGPRPGAREVVNRSLQARPSLSKDQWFLQYWQPLEVPKEVADFIYEKFQFYSKIDLSKVVPSDRIVEDLQFDKVCWQDWDFDFFEDFRERFHVDISKSPGLTEIKTIRQLVLFLADAIQKSQV